MSVLKTCVFACSILLAISAIALANHQEQGESKTMSEEQMPLGSFSISLAVSDIEASKAFYEKLDFRQAGGNLEQNWVIMRNGQITIGLFQGMFETNIMTFNPGWNQQAEALESFTDVRDILSALKERGIDPVTETGTDAEGPASFVMSDPDGNTILFDQHVAKPEK